MSVSHPESAIHPVPKPVPETLRVLAMPDGTWSVEERRGAVRGVTVREINPGMWRCSCQVRVRGACEHIASVRELERQRRGIGPDQAPMANRSGAGIGFSGSRWSECDPSGEMTDPADLYGTPWRRMEHGR